MRHFKLRFAEHFKNAERVIHEGLRTFLQANFVELDRSRRVQTCARHVNFVVIAKRNGDGNVFVDGNAHDETFVVIDVVADKFEAARRLGNSFGGSIELRLEEFLNAHS